MMVALIKEHGSTKPTPSSATSAAHGLCMAGQHVGPQARQRQQGVVGHVGIARSAASLQLLLNGASESSS